MRAVAGLEEGSGLGEFDAPRRAMSRRVRAPVEAQDLVSVLGQILHHDLVELAPVRNGSGAVEPWLFGPPERRRRDERLVGPAPRLSKTSRPSMSSSRTTLRTVCRARQRADGSGLYKPLYGSFIQRDANSVQNANFVLSRRGRPAARSLLHSHGPLLPSPHRRHGGGAITRPGAAARQ